MKNNLILVTVIMLFNITSLFSQEGKDLKYAVITYIVDSNNKQHPPKEFYWIIPLDYLKGSNDFKIFPLYFEEFSINELKKCQEKKEIDIFRIDSDDNFSFENMYIENVKKLKSLIDKNRKKFFQIIKKWNNKYKEITTAYITPITGNFCNCNISHESGIQIDYNGEVYLPLSDFNYNEILKNQAINNIISSDMSNYNIINKR